MTAHVFPSADPQWPITLEQQLSEHGLSIRVQVPKALRWFEGHFPQQPVLPGVVQLWWAEAAARKRFPVFDQGFQVKSLKFNRMILPDSEVTLSLAADEPTSRIRFQWTQDGDTCSSGSFYPQRSEVGTAAE